MKRQSVFQAKLLFCCLLGFLTSIPVCNAADTDKTIFQKCDKNGDGRLDDHELYVYSLHTGKAAAYWEAVDPTYEGKINPQARAKMEQESQEAAQTQVERERVTAGETRRDETRIGELYPSGEASSKNLRMQLYGFEIARTYDQITVDPSVLNDPTAANKAFQTAQPAIFSYKHDFVTGEETWQTSGVIAYPIKIAPEFWIAPSVAIERIITKLNEKADKDSLVFRLQYERTEPDFLLTRSTTFRGNILFNTNSDFEHETVGGELDVQPATGLPGNERFDYHIPGIKWRWQAFLHLEGGGDIDRNEIGSAADFVRLGPKANLTAYVLLNPADLDADLNNRIQIAVDYNYFTSLNTALDAWLLRTQLIAYIDKEHHVSLSGEYSKGFAPLTNTKSEQFLLTLGVKF